MNQFRSQGKFSYFSGMRPSHELRKVSVYEASWRLSFPFSKSICTEIGKILKDSRKNFRWVVCEPTIGSYNGRLQMKLTDWKPFQTLLGEPRLRTRIGTQKMTNLDFKKSFFYNRKNLSQNRTNFLRQKVF